MPETLDTTTFRVGLRFPRSQARVLRNVAQRLNQADVDREHTSLFDKAAEATAMGEPLIVFAENLLEVELMAAAFPRFGVVRPTIEELSGPGG